jgi:hypothetical protein
MNELALQASAALLWLGAVGIGATACAVLPLSIRSHGVPTVKGIRLFGGGAFERLSSGMFNLLLAAFVVVCVARLSRVARSVGGLIAAGPRLHSRLPSETKAEIS